MIEPTRVLVVDDDNDFCELTALTLEPYGYEVTPAHNGEMALDTIASGSRFDIMITDGQMPIMDGLELIKKVRMDTDPKVYNMPIILRSGDSGLKERANVLGATFIDKCNTDPYILELTIEKMLSGELP